MGALVVIPARYGSTRFPGKPLALLRGRPVIQHVYERAAQSTRAEDVVVATDDERIVAAVARFGGRAVMTSPAARTGTERVAEVARGRQAQVIINVQGDEPLIRAEMIDQLVEYLERHRAVPMASLMTPIHRREDLERPHLVKVVVDRDGFALYFSRAPIPSARPPTGSRVEGRGSREDKTPSPFTLHPSPYYKHLGIYGYQRHFLLRFPHLPPTPLEQHEQLEQLRALEHGHRIKLLETAHDTIGVDTPEDLVRVETLLVALGKTVPERMVSQADP